MEITFQHPKSSQNYVADINPNATPEVCLAGLQKESFITKGEYELQNSRTGHQIPTGTALKDCAVLHGDHIQILEVNNGAGKCLI
ncbi:hypothetical protein [Gimesia panareensis]|uniref:hypothetical protein n=1 Tax=Gimesia panareensis TaxID=2527978 RepID=UPI00118BD8B7|nr:hypothetical protein [Gimesia panareensis]QDU52114.1 hypothetical protein Pan110_44860 [Gimesia panareensis]